MSKITERGWGGHFICANRCRFRRNTLVEDKDIKVVVSTVGLMESLLKDGEFETIGFNRHYETMAFMANNDGRYWDADVGKQVYFESPWTISEIDADDKANNMHDKVVREIVTLLDEGTFEVPT